MFKKLGDLQGFSAISKPEEYGGLGLDYTYTVLMAETLGRIEGGRRADGDRGADGHVHPGAGQVRECEELKKEFLEPRRSRVIWSAASA